MKLSLYYYSLLSCLISFCAGYGQTGAAERIMFYSAYLCEHEMGTAYTIAPGCIGEKGGRCTFDEFMRYIWAEFPEKGDMERPTKDLMRMKTEFIDTKLATLLKNINGWKRVELKHAITGNIDSARLFPKSINYFDAMVKCGNVVSQMKTFHESLEEKSTAKAKASKLLKLAKEAADYVVDIRASEMDNNRVSSRREYLEKKLGFPVATKDCRDTTGNLKKGLKVWDAEATLRPDPEGRRDKILDVWMSWESDPSHNFSNRKHLLAMISARKAASYCGC